MLRYTGLLLLAAVTFGCARSRTADNLDFIGKLGGTPSGSTVNVPKGLECESYMFGKRFDEVKAAIRGEVGPPAMDDELATIFVTKSLSYPIRILVTHRQALNYNLACVVLVGTHEALAPIAARYGWRANLNGQEDILFPTYAVNPMPEEPRVVGNIVKEDVIWTNTGYSDAVVTITDCQYDQYDSLESMEMSFSVAPLQRKTVSLTYPLEASRISSDGKTKPRTMGWKFATEDGSTGGLPFVDDHPLTLKIDSSNVKEPKLACYIAEDGTGRPVEVRKVRALEDSKTVWQEPGPITSPAGRGVTINASALANAGPVTVTAEYRQLPNQRWRSASQKLEVKSGSASPNRAPPALSLVATHKLQNGFDVQVFAEQDPPGSNWVRVSKGGRQLASLRTRSLIESWLPNDAFWGGHPGGNEIRFADGRGKMIGVVSTVAPVPDGFLLDMGMTQLGPSVPSVGTDFILRWRAAAPQKWEVFDQSTGGDRPGEGHKLFNYRGDLFLVSGATVFKLARADLKRTPIVTLPASTPQNEVSWGVAQIAGSKVILKSEGIYDDGLHRFKLDLVSGELWQSGADGVHMYPVVKKHADPDGSLPSLQGGFQPDRQLGASLDRNHGPADWNRWIGMAGDKRRSPEDRNLAFMQLMDLVVPWGHGPWTVPAIRTAHEAIRSGPEPVRLGAVRTVRAWIYNYPQPIRSWTAPELAELRSILADPIFQKEVLDGAEGPVDASDESGHSLTGGPDPSFRVMVASYDQALALAEAPAATQFFLDKLRNPVKSIDEELIRSFGYLPLRTTQGPLYRLADRVYSIPLKKKESYSFDALKTFTAIIAALYRGGQREFGRFVKQVGDKKIDWRFRGAMADALALFADASIERALVQRIKDPRERESLRSECVTDLARMPGNIGYQDAAAIAKGSTGDLRQRAQLEIKSWKQFSTSDLRSSWGFGPMTQNRY